jgi:hypothetical protein
MERTENALGFLCREAGTPAQFGREGVGVDPGETGELGDIEHSFYLSP